MMTGAVVGTIAAYVLLAVLLLSLNIASLWRWWIKAAAIVLTALVFVGSYIAITGLIGWPSDSTMPSRFSLLATRIVEPDALHDAPGHIYLWIEEIDANQIVVSPPRAFEVAYKVELAADVADAQQKLEGGSPVMGEFAAEESQAGSRQASPNQSGDEANTAGGQQQGQATGAAGVVIDTIPQPSLSFSDMPPVGLPDKGPVVLGN